jgi:MoaA/NifB/PqqE/SkfB family radical SAM enzyme
MADLGRTGDTALADIWNGQPARDVRRQMLDGQLGAICPTWCPRLYRDSDKPRVTHGVADAFNRNVDRMEAEISAGATRLRSLPVDFRVFPTSRCNLRCIMCGQSKSDGSDWSTALQSQVIGFYPYARSILGVGGEPLLSASFLAMIRDFEPDRFPDCRFRVITNGTPLTAEVVAMMPRRFDHVAISIDSVQPHRLEAIRPGLRWAQLISGIDRVLDHPQRDFPVQLAFTVMRANYDEIGQFVDFARERGAQPALYPVLNTWHGQQLSEEQRIHVLTLLRSLGDGVANLEGCVAYYSEGTPPGAGHDC